MDALCPLDLQCGLVYGSLYLVSGLNLWFRSVICGFSRFAAFELGDCGYVVPMSGLLCLMCWVGCEVG